MKYLLPLFLVLLFVAGVPLDAFAQAAQNAADVSGQAKTLASQASNVPKLIAVGGYIIGTYCAIKGLLALRAWVAEPEKNPITVALAYLVVASLLILLPYTIALFRNTMGASPQYNMDSAGSAYIEQGLTASTMGTAKDFRNVQYNISQNVYQVPKLVAIMAYICGVFFAATGLLRLKDWINDSSRNPLNPALFRLATAALMIAFPHILLVATSTFFAYGGQGNSASVKVNIKTKMGKLSPFTKN